MNSGFIRARVGVMMKYFFVVMVVERRKEPRCFGEDETCIDGNDEIVECLCTNVRKKSRKHRDF